MNLVAGGSAFSDRDCGREGRGVSAARQHGSPAVTFSAAEVGTRHSPAWQAASMIEMGSPVIFNLQAPSGWQSKVDCPLAESARPCTVAAPVAQGWVAGVSSVLHWQYSAALEVQAGAHKGQQPPRGGTATHRSRISHRGHWDSCRSSWRS